MSPHYQILMTSLTSLVICFFAIPSIIKVAKLKHLYDEPCERKKHTQAVPTLGGIAIFAGFIFSITFWSNQSQIVELQYIISSLFILFFLGIKDDIVNLVAHKKLIGQVLAASVLVFFADIRLTSMYGIFEVYSLSYLASCSFSLLIIIGLTNAINLIDGIDTLAASVGVLATTLFGLWFYLSLNYQYAILSAAMVGALVAFLYYNKTPASIFMGDTGSLVLGLTISVLAIKFIEFNRYYIGPEDYRLTSVPAIAISILIIPIFDLCRVFTIRVLQGKSPLHPDRNHLHHILIDIGYSHIKSTLILLSFNIFLIAFTVSFQKMRGETLLFINMIFAVAFTYYISRKRRIIFSIQHLDINQESNPTKDSIKEEKENVINLH